MSHINDAAKTPQSVGMEDDVSKQQDKNGESPQLKKRSTKEEYFACLNAWKRRFEYEENLRTALISWYLMATCPAMLPRGYMSVQEQPQCHANHVVSSAPQQLQRYHLPGLASYEYVIIASFCKRIMAEAIDTALLFLAQFVIAVAVICVWDWDIVMDINKGLLSVSIDFMGSSRDLLLLEALSKFLVCICEAFWLSMSQGYTPGKKLLGLRVLYVEEVMNLRPQHQQHQRQRQFNAPLLMRRVRVLAHPATVPSFPRAFLRAVYKSIATSILFPTCLLMLFYNNYRTAYDLLAKTIVVECDPQATYRRRQMD